MNVYLKILLGQESGYSRNKPNQRGKYLLIPSECWPYFPSLSSGVRNSFCSMRIRTSSSPWVGVFYVWHNTKLFPDSSLSRAHNERRIYRNNALDDALNLDKDVIVCLYASADSETDYIAASIEPGNTEYEAARSLLAGESSRLLPDSSLATAAPTIWSKINATLDAPSSPGQANEPSIANDAEVLKDAKKFLKHLGPVEAITDDPLIALSSSFKTQVDFSDAVRRIYKGQCALRRSYIYKDHPVGLDAAHVHGKYNGGNNLPSNGILLCSDLHRAFDEGIWTLSDNLCVIVHDRIKDGILMAYQGKKLAIPAENKAFQPFAGYVKWHRQNCFGRFIRA